MYRQTALATACALACAFTALGASPASAISTYKSWDGSQAVGSFGCPNTTTYGQVITVKKKTMLNKFTFSWINGTTGSMVVRGEVYAWDGSKATGSALWESSPKTISFQDSAFHSVSFKPGALPLTQHGQYVLFASIDKDFEQCTASYVLNWGSVDDSVYAGGTFVYQNNGGDEGQWTTSAWNTFGIDLAFNAAMSN
jgi:hypothetical protein